MKNLFLKSKPCAILLFLKDETQTWYPSKLARESGTSYVHTVNLLVDLKKEGVVVTDKKGKQNMYRLTEKGMQIAMALDELVKRCEGKESKQKVELPEPPIAPVVNPEELAKIEKKMEEGERK
ncbi:MAG: hypothetical protein NTV88_04105 [Candidatus Micrarchaeota archaeon]|nr:hypothetical protein [Candidatus Micrarchaeota archaeon]